MISLKEESPSRLETLAEKQLMWTRLGALSLAGTFAVVLITVLAAAPRIGAVLGRAEQAADSLEQVSRQLEQADIPGLLEEVDGLVSQSTDTAEAAMEKIEELDVASLNKAIVDLKNLIEPLARLFGR